MFFGKSYFLKNARNIEIWRQIFFLFHGMSLRALKFHTCKFPVSRNRPCNTLHKMLVKFTLKMLSAKAFVLADAQIAGRVRPGLSLIWKAYVAQSFKKKQSNQKSKVKTPGTRGKHTFKLQATEGGISILYSSELSRICLLFTEKSCCYRRQRQRKNLTSVQHYMFPRWATSLVEYF